MTTTENTDRIEASKLVAALESAYSVIRTNHPELPQHMVFVIGQGLTARGLKWGHHIHDAWMPAQPIEIRRVAGARVAMRTAHKGPRYTELFISGERLAEGAVLTLQTLLHECAHALGYANSVAHMGSNGRHLKAFVGLAEILGLEYAHEVADPQLGYSAVTLRPETIEKYRDVIDALAGEITVYLDTLKRFGIGLAGGATRGTDGTTQIIRAPRVDKRDHNNVKLECACGTKIRLSRKNAETARILCEDCGEHFTDR